MEEAWHAKPVDVVFTLLQTQKEGISQSEASSRLLKYGPNKIATSPSPSLWKLFFHQFANPLILILIAASTVKLAVSSFIDGFVLLATVWLMVLISFFQEMRAEKAMQALKKLASHKTKVRRENKVDLILSEKLVPGDIILLEMGDKIPADARLIEAHYLKMDESMLTGESLPIEKQIDPLEGTSILADRKNMIYEGTVVAYGKGAAVITQTGMHTELGKIAQNIESIEIEPTPLQKDIASISQGILKIILSIILLLAAISFYKGMPILDIFLLCVAAAVSAIPEGLPAAFTVTLSAGMQLMAKKNVIIRKLIAVETLGATTVICSDKTGTLTLNQMTVTTLFSVENLFELPQKEPLSAAYQERRPESKSSDANESQNLRQSEDKTTDSSIKSGIDPLNKKILRIGVLCNNSLLSEEKGSSKVIGDPMEGALLIAAESEGLSLEAIRNSSPRLSEIPFISENLYMATLHATENGRLVCVKGAPEKLLSFSSYVLTSSGPKELDASFQDQIKKGLEQMTEKALRPLAAAYYETKEEIKTLKEEDFKGKLVFAGVFGMIDPPRKEVIESIELCKKAGVRVAMITGDHPATALVIAKQIGISTNKALSGADLNGCSDETLKEKIEETSVFARVEPNHKFRIVKAFQAKGHCVAMTGDGVNDAPALEAANIGIAMGLSGTDVAKESADMILTNDRFDSIVAAVEEGRAIFDRLRNVSALLLITCFGELFGLMLCVFSIGITPLTPLQILWVNLVSGSIIAIPLGLEAKTGKEMDRPPRSTSSRLLYPGLIYRISSIAALLGLSAFFIFLNTYQTVSLEKARSLVLTSILIFEWLLAFHMSSHEKIFGFFKNSWLLISLGIALGLQLCILYIPPFSELFHTEPLSLKEWALSSLPGCTVLLLEALRKKVLPQLFYKGK